MSALNDSDRDGASARNLTTLLAEVACRHRSEDKTDLQNRLGSTSHFIVHGGDELTVQGAQTMSQLESARFRVAPTLDWSRYPYRVEPGRGDFKFVDLFCGIGGMRLAYQLAGGQSVFSSDIDERARDTYLANFGEMPFGDIRTVDPKLVPDHDILLAGFPCQTFSMAGQRKGFDDKRGTLVFTVAAILAEKRPAAFLLENVKGLTNHDHDGFNTLDRIGEALAEAGYVVCNPQILNARDFGVAQNRERVFIVGFRDDDAGRAAQARFEFPHKLPEGAPVGLSLSNHLDDVIEFARSREPVEARYFLSEQYLNTLEKHKQRHKALGHGFGYHVFEEDDLAVSCAHTLLLGGMGLERNLVRDPLEPIAGDRGRQLPMNHAQVRKLTPVECRRLQGFPDDFVLPGVGSARQGHLYRQFANSVAVPVIYAIARRMTAALGIPEGLPVR